MAEEVKCPQRGRKCYTVQGFANPIEYDVPLIYDKVPEPPPYPEIMSLPYNPPYTINPDTGEFVWTEWPEVPNPSYPGHFKDDPIRVLPQQGNNPYYPYRHFDLSKTLVPIGNDSGSVELYGTAGNIMTLNPPYEGVNPKLKKIAKVSKFRIGQLINVRQQGGIGCVSIPDVPTKPADPNVLWELIFDTYQKNAALAGQEVSCSWSDNLNQIQAEINGVIKTTLSGPEYDTIVISVTNLKNYGGMYIRFGCDILKPINLKSQITDIQFDENLESETVGRQDIFFDTYEVENRLPNNDSPIGQWIVEWQTKTLVPYRASRYGKESDLLDIGSSNYVQNENYTARLSYRYKKLDKEGNNDDGNWTVCNNGFPSARLEAPSEQLSNVVVTSDTPYRRSGYTEICYNAKWTLTEDEEINKPWKGNTVSFKHYHWKTTTTTTYSPYNAYPDYVTDPDYPYGGRPTTTYSFEIDDGVTISKTFAESDFNIYSSNYNSYTKSVWGTIPSVPLSTEHYLSKYRVTEYDSHFIDFTFYYWDSVWNVWRPETRNVPTYSVDTAIDLNEPSYTNQSLQDQYVYALISLARYKIQYGSDANFPFSYIGDYVNYGGYTVNYYDNSELNYLIPTPPSFLP